MMSPNLENQQQHINNSLDGENLGLGPFLGCHSLCISESKVALIGYPMIKPSQGKMSHVLLPGFEAFISGTPLEEIFEQ